MSEEQVYSIEEAAQLLRVSIDTIRRMIKRGQIEAHQVGRQWRIPKREVDRLLGKQ
jgi:excisionase family DNA binding protein